LGHLFSHRHPTPGKTQNDDLAGITISPQALGERLAGFPAVPIGRHSYIIPGKEELGILGVRGRVCG